MTMARRYRAILIGNSRFAQEPRLSDLEGPTNDLPLMISALTDERRGLFHPEDVARLSERRVQEMREEIEEFFANATRDDVLVFYYSGHGVRSAGNQLFLCAADSNLARLNSTAIGSRWLNDAMADSAARTIVIVLDCCHSGAFKNADIAAPLAGLGRFVLTSSRAAQLTPDTVDRNAPSVFTGHLTAGLAGAGAVRTIHDLYQYVHRQMSGYGSAEPQFHTEGSGELLITRGDQPEVARAAQLTLSSTAIRFPTPIPQGTTPPVRRIFVHTDSTDWVADSPVDWVRITSAEGFFDVILDPPIGSHVAYIYVHDRATGSVAELPIEVIVSAAADDEPGWSPSQMTQIRHPIQDWIKASPVPGLETVPTPATWEWAISKTRLSATEAVSAVVLERNAVVAVFTDEGIHVLGRTGLSCRYADLPRSTVSNPSPGRIAFDGGRPYRVGEENAAPLADMLNGFADYINRHI